jgi:hypothetical protein
VSQEEVWQSYLEEREWMASFEYKRDGEDVPRGTRGALDFETPSVSEWNWWTGINGSQANTRSLRNETSPSSSVCELSSMSCC